MIKHINDFDDEDSGSDDREKNYHSKAKINIDEESLTSYLY